MIFRELALLLLILAIGEASEETSFKSQSVSSVSSGQSINVVSELLSSSAISNPNPKVSVGQTSPSSNATNQSSKTESPQSSVQDLSSSQKSFNATKLKTNETKNAVPGNRSKELKSFNETHAVKKQKQQHNPNPNLSKYSLSKQEVSNKESWSYSSKTVSKIDKPNHVGNVTDKRETGSNEESDYVTPSPTEEGKMNIQTSSKSVTENTNTRHYKKDPVKAKQEKTKPNEKTTSNDRDNTSNASSISSQDESTTDSPQGSTPTQNEKPSLAEQSVTNSPSDQKSTISPRSSPSQIDYTTYSPSVDASNATMKPFSLGEQTTPIPTPAVLQEKVKQHPSKSSSLHDDNATKLSEVKKSTPRVETSTEKVQAPRNKSLLVGENPPTGEYTTTVLPKPTSRTNDRQRATTSISNQDNTIEAPTESYHATTSSGILKGTDKPVKAELSSKQNKGSNDSKATENRKPNDDKKETAYKSIPLGRSFPNNADNTTSKSQVPNKNSNTSPLSKVTASQSMEPTSETVGTHEVRQPASTLSPVQKQAAKLIKSISFQATNNRSSHTPTTVSKFNRTTVIIDNKVDKSVTTKTVSKNQEQGKFGSTHDQQLEKYTSSRYPQESAHTTIRPTAHPSNARGESRYQCVATVPRLNLHLQMMLGGWYPVKISRTTSKLWVQSFKKEHNISNIGCLSMEYSMINGGDPDILNVSLLSGNESTRVEAMFVGDAKHPKESIWAISWPNGEDTLTSVVAAGVIGGERNRYTWLLTVDCDLNGLVEPDWAVMARKPEGISNSTLTTILAIVEGLKGLNVENAITYKSDDCHK